MTDKYKYALIDAVGEEIDRWETKQDALNAAEEGDSLAEVHYKILGVVNIKTVKTVSKAKSKKKK